MKRWKYLPIKEANIHQTFIDACLFVLGIKEDDLIETIIDKIIEYEEIEIGTKEEAINITVKIKKI